MFTLWAKTMTRSKDGSLRTPKWSTMICVSIIGAIFFLVGLFQTVIAVVFVEASRRNSILVLGPLFMGVGIMLFFSVFEMCMFRHRKRKVNLTEDSQTVEEDEEGNLHFANNTIVIRADQLPALLTLTPDQLSQLGPDQKRLLLAQPALPPVDVFSPEPAYYTGNTRLPEIANYSPPEEGEPMTVPKLVQESKEGSASGEDVKQELQEPIADVTDATAPPVQEKETNIVEETTDKVDSAQEQRNISVQIMEILESKKSDNEPQPE